MPRKVQQIPDYFTPKEAATLVEGAPSYPTRMALRTMLKTGLRVSEALALRRVDLRLTRTRRPSWCGPTRRETKLARAGRSPCRPI